MESVTDSTGAPQHVDVSPPAREVLRAGRGRARNNHDSTSRVESYQYDANSNRSQMTVQLVNSVTSLYSYYPNSDRMKSDGTYGYAYDNNGNLIAKGTSYTDNGTSVSFSPTDGEYWSYAYDLKNQLVSVSHGTAGTQSAAPVTSYTYDPMGLKIETVSAARGTSYTVYGTDGNVASDQSTANGTTTTDDYLYLFGRYFAKRTTVTPASGSATTTTSYYLTDNLGSTVMETDPSGKVIWSTDYTAFGKSGAEAGNSEETGRYTGKDLDSETGLYYSNARWYDPENGRFLTEDPAKDGQNWYIYANDNPLAFVDPSGLDPTVPSPILNAGTISAGPVLDVRYRIANAFASFINFTATGQLITAITGKTLAASMANPGGLTLQSEYPGTVRQARMAVAGNAALIALGGVEAVAGDGAQFASSAESSLVRSSLPDLKGTIADAFEGEYGLRTFKAGQLVHRSPWPNEDVTNPGSWFGTRRSVTKTGTDSLYQITKWDNPNSSQATYRFTRDITVYYGKVAGGTGYQILIPQDVNPSSVLEFLPPARALR